MSEFDRLVERLPRHAFGGVNWCSVVQAALFALAAERRRAAALDKLARMDGALVAAGALTPEPRSISHWGMFA